MQKAKDFKQNKQYLQIQAMISKSFHGLDAKRFMKFSVSLGREKGTHNSASASAKCWEGREGMRERKTGQVSEL